MDEPNEEPVTRVRWVYSSQSTDEVRDRYDVWAEHYDRDLTATYDYVLPEITAQDFGRWVQPDASILDAGAGTGLVGVELRRLGYTDLTAMDISPAMLVEAAKTECYNSLHEMTLGEPLGFRSERFDAVISVGTFTDGHAPASGMVELTRITRPGGHVVVAIRDDIIVSHGFDAVFETLIGDGTLRLLERTEPRVAMPKTEPDITVQTWCFEVV